MTRASRFFALLTVTGIAVAVVPAAAQSTAPKLGPVTVSPALKTALANKKKVTPAAIAQHLSYSGGTPLLRVKSGRQYALEPTDAPAPSAAESKPTPIPPSMQKYASYINAFQPGSASKAPTGGNVPVLLRVDHRPDQSAVKDQGRRNTCVAFASVAALEAGYRKRGRTADISENHAYNLFMPYVGKTCHDDKGVPTWKAATWLNGRRICNEADSPYVSDEKAAGTDCATIQPACSDKKTYGFAETIPLFGMAGGAGVLSVNNTNYLEAFLDMGYDIVGGFWLTGTDWSDGTAESGVIDVQLDSSGNPLGGSGGHAMLIVGYDRPGSYFIIKNSYGTDFGHAGYAHVSYEYMQTYAKYGFVVKSVYVDLPQAATPTNVVAAPSGPSPARAPSPAVKK